MNHAPRKRFGQHFLHDRQIIARLLAAIDVRGDDHVVEIGPGEGVLTTGLAARARRVDVVEIDRDLAAALPARVPTTSLHIHVADALRFDFATLAEGPGSLRLVGNLPYNISTPLLFHLFGHVGLIRDMHVMLQKEVVERMAAAPGSRDYGRLSVTLAARCSVERLFCIGPGAFRPAPRVDSAVARLLPRPPPAPGIDCLRTFDEVVTRAFGQRRKRLGNALKGLIDATAFAAADVDPGLRAEQLDLPAFMRLANHVAQRDGGAYGKPG